ncbi:serine/threonine-protein kinase [Microvirga sp. 0TCS3.31]
MIAGRYRLEKEIGRGGAGVVHLAHDELLDRRVAVKRIGLLPGTTSDDVSRAQREARLAAGISHQHVVSIFDLVKDEDCYWLVMEHVEGRTLAELVSDEGALPLRRAASILAQAADGLVQAGTAGVVHRDVKPSNIFVGADDRAKLGDFGIARAASDTVLTQTGMITGSPAYLAPEVATGEPATPASDVWSLGGTLFHALAGRPPYDVGDNVLGGLYKIVHEDPPRLPDDHPAAGLLAAVLVKDPTQRWPVARVRDDLRRLARGERSQAPAPAGRDGQATAVMAAAPPATPSQARSTTTGTSSGPATAAPAPPAARVATPAPTPAPSPATDTSRGRSRGWMAAVVALVLVAGIGAWLLWPRDDEPGDAGGSGSSPSASQDPTSDTPSESPSDTPSDSPSNSPSESPSTTDEPTTDPSPSNAAGGTPAAMRSFVQDYFATVTSDPESTFAMLTPEFQSASGGIDGYTGFWSTIESATPRAIKADPRTLSTTYTIDFVTTSGQTRTEQGQLQLEQQGDGFLIAGEG